MTAEPDMADLLAAVSRWLEAGAPGAGGFHGKVAANALAIVQRQLAQWPAAEARAIARLEAITDRTGTFEALEAALCASLRDGTLSVRDPRVLAHLRETTLDRLAIDQPSYRSLLARP